MNVLAITAEAEDLSTLQAVLREAFPTCTLLTAPNGKRSLELARTENPDVILLGMAMTDMDGFEICRQLKTNNRWRPMPIVFLAPRSEREHRGKALASGADAFLSTPLDEYEVTATIRTMVQVKKNTLLRSGERAQLELLIADRTQELRQNQVSLLNAMEDLRVENEGRTRAEAILRTSEERYAQLAAHSRTYTWEVDIHGLYTFVAPMAGEILGYHPDELIGRKHFYDLAPAEDRDAVREFGMKTIENAQAIDNYENRAVAKDGRTVWLLTDAMPLRGEQGEIIGARGVDRDISERRRAETYREMGREILQVLNEPLDTQDAIEQILAIMKERTGVDALGIRLQDGADFPYFVQVGFPKDFLRKENTLIERDRAGGVCRDEDGNIRLECTCGLVISGRTDPTNPLFTKGGSCWTPDSFPLLDIPPSEDPRLHPRNNCIHQGYCSVALVPIRSKDRIVGLLQLNDRRKDRFTLETVEIIEGIAAHIGSALMRRQADEERTELADQLRQSQRLESLGRLAGGVAHDFNNMLQTIIGTAEMAMENLAPSDPLYADLREIHQAGNRSVTVIRQLLAFARKQVIEPRKLDLNDATASTLKMLRPLIGEDIDLVWLPGAHLWPVKMDPGQVDQLVTNLCVNARDAIEGRGKIIIETGNVTIDASYRPWHVDVVPGDYVRCSISDNGCGMGEEVQARIFEPFFTTKGIGQGTGLGLATVYGIVKQNNGFVNVYSEPGKGTTFRMYLPRFEGQDMKVDTAAITDSPDGTETILLVEDEKSVRRTAARFLERLGYSVLAAAAPAEALRVADKYAADIHLLLTDIVMPGMNGRELAETLAKTRPGLKVLYMSGYTANVIAHQGVLDEDMAFLSKPFTRNSLAVKVRDVLDDGVRSGDQHRVRQEGDQP